MTFRNKRAGSVTRKIGTQRRGLDPRLIEYLLSKNGQHLDFAKHFSGEVITAKDRKDLQQFIQALRLRKRGYGAPTIARRIGRPTPTVSYWIAGASVPRAVWLARAYIELGPPKLSCIWRQFTRRRRSLPQGPWIQVPEKGKFRDLRNAVGLKKVAEIARIEPELIKHIVNTKTLNAEFLQDFWEETPTQRDIKQLGQYGKATKLWLQGYSYEQIARVIQRSAYTAKSWPMYGSKPWMVRLLNLHLKLGKPRKGWKWLVSFQKYSGLPVEPIVQVPERINSFTNILEVLGQLGISNETPEHAKKFGLTLTDVERLRPELFAFLLGTLVGDAGKQLKKSQRILSMNIQLNLTKSHDSNLRLGEFVSLCANAIGLKMHRIKDPVQQKPAPRENTAGTPRDRRSSAGCLNAVLG